MKYGICPDKVCPFCLSACLPVCLCIHNVTDTYASGGAYDKFCHSDETSGFITNLMVSEILQFQETVLALDGIKLGRVIVRRFKKRNTIMMSALQNSPA